MPAVPVTIQCMIYPRDKSSDPYPATIVGFASITGLSVGGGPIITPPDGIVEPPLEIWPNPPEGQAPLPEHPIVMPPDMPPVSPPSDTGQKPKPGWNWYSGPEGSGWYWAYLPGQGQASPKK